MSCLCMKKSGNVFHFTILCFFYWAVSINSVQVPVVQCSTFCSSRLPLTSGWKIWCRSSLSDCNWTRTHNHLVLKRTLNHLAKLAKWLSCVGSTYLHGAFDCTDCTYLYGAFDCTVQISTHNTAQSLGHFG